MTFLLCEEMDEKHATDDQKYEVGLLIRPNSDSNNLIIPTIQSEYNNYAAIRTPVLAIPISGTAYNAIPISPANSDGHSYGLHPACPELASLFSSGKLYHWQARDWQAH